MSKRCLSCDNLKVNVNECVDDCHCSLGIPISNDDLVIGSRYDVAEDLSVDDLKDACKSCSKFKCELDYM